MISTYLIIGLLIALGIYLMAHDRALIEVEGYERNMGFIYLVTVLAWPAFIIFLVVEATRKK